jgi:F0F1-type ATP synthase assembly protein I
MAVDPHRDDAWSGLGTGWAVTSTMIGGMVAWGALGFLADRLVGTDNVFLAIGVVLGALGGTYIVWLRYGRGDGGGT